MRRITLLENMVLIHTSYLTQAVLAQDLIHKCQVLIYDGRRWDATLVKWEMRSGTCFLVVSVHEVNCKLPTRVQSGHL